MWLFTVLQYSTPLDNLSYGVNVFLRAIHVFYFRRYNTHDTLDRTYIQSNYAAKWHSHRHTEHHALSWVQPTPTDNICARNQPWHGGVMVSRLFTSTQYNLVMVQRAVMQCIGEVWQASQTVVVFPGSSQPRPV